MPKVLQATMNGHTLTLPEVHKEHLWNYLGGDDRDEEIKLKFTNMSDAEFAALPEFDGF